MNQYTVAKILSESTIQRVKHFLQPLYQYVANSILRFMYRLFSLESIGCSLKWSFKERIFKYNINCNSYILLFKVLGVIGKYMGKDEKNDY